MSAASEGRVLDVTVVSACFNEASCLRELADRVLKALESANVNGRLLVVDDGSEDESVQILTELAEADPRISFVRLSRNFGQQAAISAGLDHAPGDAVILLDGDLQDPPELIPELLDRFREGYEVVYGIRGRRQESAWKRGAYRAFYALLTSVADLDIPEHAGDFGLLSRRVVEVMQTSQERHRFLRGLRRWAGFRQIGVSYDRPSRSQGDTKYSLRKLIRLGMDGLIAFSSAPLRIATLAGVASAFGAALFLVYTIGARIMEGPVVPGWTSLIAVIVGMGGLQLIVLGVIGEYIGRIYDETKGRPLYVVESRANLPETTAPGSTPRIRRI